MMDILTLNLSCFNVLFVILSILLTILWFRNRRPVDFPPGPTSYPIIGNFHTLANGDFIGTMRSLRKQYGDIFSLSLGSFWVIVVNGTENLRELLVKRGDATSDRPGLYLFHIAKNKGVGSSSGSAWKQQRTFTISKLRDFGFGKRSFESSIMEEVEIFLNYMESYNGEAFDFYDMLQTSIGNNVMSILLGRRFDYDDPKFLRFTRLFNENINSPALRGPLNFIPVLGHLPGDLFGAKQLLYNAEQLFEFFREEIREHEKTLDTENPRDFIDTYLIELIQQKKEGHNDIYSEEQLESIIGDLFAAGTETSTTTIRWAILYMLHDKDIQNKMRREIDEVVGCGRLPSMSDKSNLPYCEAVILESLRIGNIVPYSLPHNISEDVHYKGFKIPKGTVLFPSLESVSFDEQLFPRSHEFKPERFIDSNGALFGQEKVLTFSLGRRVCLGEALARMELFLYLTALVQRFEFLPPEGECPPPINGNLGITYAPDVFKFRAVPRR